MKVAAVHEYPNASVDDPDNSQNGRDTRNRIEKVR